ncbi:MAG: PTS sugar transporter subunit IIA [Candidatus Riflebacteria bacterium]|nr:PTS sugar transporter subunit IIA [Candidatus Riflebacteria bacterium]
MISELLQDSFIDLQLDVTDKATAIDKLSAMLCGSGKVSDQNHFVSAVLEREKLGSTAIGAGIAIPHARANTVNEVSIAFARSSQGIDFNSADGDPVNLIFLLAAPVESGSLYLKLLARISRLLRYQDLIDSLKNATTKEEVISIIASKE